MKVFALLLALLLPALAQAQPAAGYEINGHIKGLADGTRVYLISGFRRIDSAAVRQERFTLRGRLAEPLFTYLYAGRGRDTRKLTDILLENRAVTVTGSQPDYDHVTVVGSEVTQQFRDWFAEDGQLAGYRIELSKAYKALPAQDSTAGRLLRLSRQMQQDRVALLKRYVQRYHDSATGAALPTLCTLGKSLTASDYQEMYQALTPTWQQTGFGREILAEVRKHQAGPAGAH